MKKVYRLTCYDTKNEFMNAEQYYSNRKAAAQSLLELKKHMIKKHNMKDPEWKTWTFRDGGDHQTHILDKRYNITLVVWTVSKDKSQFV